MELKCSIPEKDCRQAKQEVKAVLIGRAKARDVISYVGLTRHITAIQLEPQSFALRTMLREIGAEENAVGRGMLSALVVSSPGHRKPDLGFLYLATQLGKNTSDIWRCWGKELKRLCACLLLGRRFRRKRTPHRRRSKHP
jgi:hypothetical protein